MVTNATHKQLTDEGRPNTWGMKLRGKIDSQLAVDMLHATIRQELEPTNQMINAARILLDRTIPTLKAYEIKSDDSGNSLKSITNLQLLDIIEGQSRLVSVSDTK